MSEHHRNGAESRSVVQEGKEWAERALGYCKQLYRHFIKDVLTTQGEDERVVAEIVREIEAAVGTPDLQEWKDYAKIELAGIVDPRHGLLKTINPGTREEGLYIQITATLTGTGKSVFITVTDWSGQENDLSERAIRNIDTAVDRWNAQRNPGAVDEDPFHASEKMRTEN